MKNSQHLQGLLQDQRRGGWYSAAQLEHLKKISPLLYECVDITRMQSDEHLLTELEQVVDFDAESCGGRGGAYRHAQQNSSVRITGIQQLFSLLSQNNDLYSLDPTYKILDVLGGDGTLTRALSSLLPSASMPSILTSDISSDMIDAAQQYGLPGLRQPAQHLFLKEASFDAVIIAYGSHHISREHRLLAAQEAWRVLKSGGRFIYHDFEEDSPVTRWFGEVVDRYSLTGHQFPHFTAEEISGYLVEAGFVDIQVCYLYDPFILHGQSPAEVRQMLANYLLDMYGLVKLKESANGESAQNSVYALAYQHFQYDYAQLGLDPSFGKTCIETYQRNGRWYIEMPRVALIGSARKK